MIEAISNCKIKKKKENKINDNDNNKSQRPKLDQIYGL